MKFLNDLTIEQIVARMLAYLVIALLLGSVVALAARMARRDADDGSDEPAAVGDHISISGLLMAVLFRQGWVRLPDPSYEKRADLATFVTAVLMPVLIVLLVDLLRPVLGGMGFGPWMRFGLVFLAEIQMLVAGIWLINFLPVPFFAGGYLAAAFLPAATRRAAKYAGVLRALLMVGLIAGWIPALGGFVLPHLSRLGGQ